MKHTLGNKLPFGFRPATWCLELDQNLYHIDECLFESSNNIQGFTVMLENDHGDFLLTEHGAWVEYSMGTLVEINTVHKISFPTLAEAVSAFTYAEFETLYAAGLI